MNIYIGNLHAKATEENLRDLFSQYGEVSTVKVIMDQYTRQSRGFGFVEMDNNAEATNAIGQINNMNFMGQFLEVNEARPRAPRSNGYSDRKSGGYQSRGDKNYNKRY